jgi:beta-glucosidase
VVLLSGSALAVPWAAEHASALVQAWYGGQAAGTAIAEVLAGDVSPSGRLPVTMFRSVDQLPAFDDYRMEGHTYRYFRGETLFPFGHGLSYARFAYRDLRLPPAVRSGDSLTVSVEVENTGAVEAEEVVELYVRLPEATVPVPIRALAGFRRVSLRPGQRQRVTFTVAPRALSVVDDTGRWVQQPGRVEISVGGKQPGQQGRGDAATTGVLTGSVSVR